MTGRIEPERPIDFNGLAIIGEAPGQEEIEKGFPFVGRSGKLLNTVLEAVGIERSRCLVTNVFLSRPEGNKIDAFFRTSTPEDAEFINRYGLYRNRVVRDENRIDMERLDTELREHRPSLLLLLGATALWRINQVNGITAARGDWTLRGEDGNLVAVMPSWHPSAVLRNSKEKLDEFVSDLKSVAEALTALHEPA